MATARLDKDGWFRCRKCGHRLGRTMGKWQDQKMMPAIEIKCHSCGEINYLMVGGQKNEK